MVFVSFMEEFPWHLDDDGLVVPLDVGRWAVISGGRPDLRRRVAADLRALSYGGPLSVRAGGGAQRDRLLSDRLRSLSAHAIQEAPEA